MIIASRPRVSSRAGRLTGGDQGALLPKDRGAGEVGKGRARLWRSNSNVNEVRLGRARRLRNTLFAPRPLATTSGDPGSGVRPMRPAWRPPLALFRSRDAIAGQARQERGALARYVARHNALARAVPTGCGAKPRWRWWRSTCNLLRLTILPPCHSARTMEKSAVFFTFDRTSSFSTRRRRSAQVLEYFRYVMPAARQCCTMVRGARVWSTLALPVRRRLASGCSDAGRGTVRGRAPSRPRRSLASGIFYFDADKYYI